MWIDQVGIQSGDADAGAKPRAVLDGLDSRGVAWTWWTYRAQTTDPAQHGI